MFGSCKHIDFTRGYSSQQMASQRLLCQAQPECADTNLQGHNENTSLSVLTQEPWRNERDTPKFPVYPDNIAVYWVAVNINTV